MTASLLDVDAVAGALGVSRWSIYRWCAAGQIPCIRAGRKVRFDLEAVISALRDHQETEAQHATISFIQPTMDPPGVDSDVGPKNRDNELRRLRSAVAATKALRR
jgi:excisionase family DNA binding protein